MSCSPWGGCVSALRSACSSGAACLVPERQGCHRGCLGAPRPLPERDPLCLEQWVTATCGGFVSFMQDLSSLLPKPCLHSLLDQALCPVFPGCNKHQEVARMVGERERSQVQWDTVPASPEVAPAGNHCPRQCPDTFPAGLSLGGGTDCGSILGDDCRAHRAFGRGVKSACPSPGTSSPPPLHFPQLFQSLPWGCGAAAWAGIRALQQGRCEPCTADGCKSHIFTALLRTAHTFCS